VSKANGVKTRLMSKETSPLATTKVDDSDERVADIGTWERAARSIEESLIAHEKRAEETNAAGIETEEDRTSFRETSILERSKEDRMFMVVLLNKK
jgi:hypothetical protein